jgi:hypothetical protein
LNELPLGSLHIDLLLLLATKKLCRISAALRPALKAIALRFIADKLKRAKFH